jgi:hypothetical protein
MPFCQKTLGERLDFLLERHIIYGVGVSVGLYIRRQTYTTEDKIEVHYYMDEMYADEGADRGATA